MLPDDAGFVFAFLGVIPEAGGALAPPLFVADHPMATGSPRGQEPLGWFLHLCIIGHFLCLWVGGVGGGV